MDKEETVSVPVGHDNPLLHKLSPKQFQAKVNFYEADHELTTEDRVVLAQDLQRVIAKTSFASYGAGVGTFLGPTVYHRLQKPPVTLANKRVVQQPFISFLLGVGAMVLTNSLMYRYIFASKAQEEETSSITRARVWKAMDCRQAAMFYLYYRKTSEDPTFIIKDPRTLTEQQLHGVHYDARSAHRATRKSPDDYASTVIGHNSHWEQIRQQNGFVEPNLETGSSESNSAWEKIRNNKE